MDEITVNVGPVSIPESRIKKYICWLPKKLVGIQGIETKISAANSNISNMDRHINALTDVAHILVADISGNWSADKRERVQRSMADFKKVNLGLEGLVAKGNPFTQKELDTLRSYTQQAQAGSTFTPEQAKDFKNLSERASREYPNQDWVKDLLIIALFIFAVYFISKVLNKE